MPLTMYRMTVPVFQRGLSAMKTYLDKVEVFAEEKKIDSSILVAGRLNPDMLSLAGQYQRATDTSKFAVVRLTGLEAPRFEDNETTISELRERVAKAEAFLASVAQEAFNGSEEREVTIGAGGGVNVTMSGVEYLALSALPNFYFHVTTAHAILREQGVPVGKRDYLGPYV
ncbi:DUF1993 domain-containing protein [Neorhizobium sp. P12A]|uniref:DUF1993 domain-containing protein n=1 Tax=Neorhizobium sp. P12A TaxID=2268027 RepID=UPI0011EC3DE9|nr:DUF1993 domain-containing protein [Neorhizobium sp. P12A]KAA0698851.1 DUF1993 domain-containing protein [Neorhizobium sp. P12A]